MTDHETMADTPRFAGRTGWDLEPNRLAVLAQDIRLAGRPISGLTESNPSPCGCRYDETSILGSLAGRDSVQYPPQPRGLLSPRGAVSGHYDERDSPVSPERILLTSGSS